MQMDCRIIVFDNIDQSGNLYKKGCIKKRDLEKLNANKYIKDYKIDKNGIKIIKGI